MAKSKVIVHMYTSLDGKIDGTFGLQEGGQASFNHCMNSVYQMSNANTFGWTSLKAMEVPGDRDLTEFKDAQLPIEDWIPEGTTAETWLLSVDPTGELAWKENYFDYGKDFTSIPCFPSFNEHPIHCRRERRYQYRFRTCLRKAPQTI